LGLLVGRGTAPVQFDMEKIQEELADLKKSAIQKEMRRYRIHPQEEVKPQLDFYDALKVPADKAPLQIPKPKPPQRKTPRKIAKKEAPPPSPSAAPTPAKEKTSLKKSSRGVAAPRPKKNRATAPKNAKFTIQVASLKNKTEAQKIVAQLQKKGYPAYRALGKVPGKGIWYRVRVGGYQTKTEAVATLRRLKRSKFNGIVIRK
jgi:cell division protein FtsN